REGLLRDARQMSRDHQILRRRSLGSRRWCRVIIRPPVASTSPGVEARTGGITWIGASERISGSHSDSWPPARIRDVVSATGLMSVDIDTAEPRPWSPTIVGSRGIRIHDVETSRSLWAAGIYLCGRYAP